MKFFSKRFGSELFDKILIDRVRLQFRKYPKT
jgi:hypothetical protein